MSPDYTSKDIERFWSKVAVTDDPDSCWEWQRAKSDKGYGKCGLGKRTFLAHRIAYLLTNGQLPELDVLHHCDNPACCNPRHLFLGTHQDNMNDMKLKERNFIPS